MQWRLSSTQSRPARGAGMLSGCWLEQADTAAPIVAATTQAATISIVRFIVSPPGSLFLSVGCILEDRGGARNSTQCHGCRSADALGRRPCGHALRPRTGRATASRTTTNRGSSSTAPSRASRSTARTRSRRKRRWLYLVGQRRANMSLSPRAFHRALAPRAVPEVLCSQCSLHG